MRGNVLAVVVTLGLGLGLGLVGACERPCEKAANCVRSCECLNAETDNRLQCAVAFRCEGKTETCEDAYDSFSCEQICAEYAAEARCGVSRCLSDDDCTRLVSCPLVDANGTPTGQFQDCRFAFACELDRQESCEPQSGVDDATLCASAVCLPP